MLTCIFISQCQPTPKLDAGYCYRCLAVVWSVFLSVSLCFVRDGQLY